MKNILKTILSIFSRYFVFSWLIYGYDRASIFEIQNFRKPWRKNGCSESLAMYSFNFKHRRADGNIHKSAILCLNYHYALNKWHQFTINSIISITQMLSTNHERHLFSIIFIVKYIYYRMIASADHIAHCSAEGSRSGCRMSRKIVHPKSTAIHFSCLNYLNSFFIYGTVNENLNIILHSISAIIFHFAYYFKQTIFVLSNDVCIGFCHLSSF